MLRRVRDLVVVLVVVSLAACSSDGDADGAAVTTSEVVTTTEATTTTTEASTTTESTEPEPEWTPEELEVIEAWEAYGEYWRLSVVDIEAALLLAPEVMAEPLLSGATSTLEEIRDSGGTIRGASEFVPLDVVLDGDRATVEECGFDGLEWVAPDGEVVVASDVAPLLGEVRFERSDGGWFAVGRNSSGPCSLP